MSAIPDYRRPVEPYPDCPACKGTGWVRPFLSCCGHKVPCRECHNRRADYTPPATGTVELPRTHYKVTVSVPRGFSQEYFLDALDEQEAKNAGFLLGIELGIRPQGINVAVQVHTPPAPKPESPTALTAEC